MTQAGGPAAINGFLYQILHHLGWLANVTLTGTLAEQEITDARLVLEPRTGGDARAEGAAIHLVEQYKTREGATWSLADIHSVLRDLRKAVSPARPDYARYRFVTDGRPGRLDELYGLLASVRSAASPDHLSAGDRDTLDRVATTTRSESLHSTADERNLVFHLLSHFEMKFGVSADVCSAAVEKLLRRYAPDLGDEKRIRQQLVGMLLEELSQGETQLDAPRVAAMLRDAGLNPDRLRKLATLAETMSALTSRRVSRLKYDSERDVRHAPVWPSDKPVLLIAGDSGVGKTWQLGRLLESCAHERQIVTLVPCAQTREDLLTQASRDFWQTGLGETSEKSIPALSNHLRELEPDSAGPRLTIALDDVQDVDLARALARQDWNAWSMRLVLTVPRTLAQSLAMTDGVATHVHEVSEFSVDELDALLRIRGQRWAELPPDLKRLLRNPILAGLFLELPYASVQTAPRSEYEIFERFWQRIPLKGQPGDEGILTALAAHMREARPYPLPRSRWEAVSLTEEAATRLDATGWLRINANGEAAFSHERLLNWAIAKSLVRELQRGDLSLEEVAAFVTAEGTGDDQRIRQRLGYVPMDVLWLLAEDEVNTDATVDLVARMEPGFAFGSHGAALYTDLLPTLGKRAVPILVERLRTLETSSSGDYTAGLIAKAFASLATQERAALGEPIALLLNAPSRRSQNVAIAALTAAPDPQHLDRLWELHQERVDALDDKDDPSRYPDYKASFEALEAATPGCPGWLRDRILEADAHRERVSELAYLLSNLEHPEASQIWAATRDALIAKVSSDKPRSLLNCITRFADREQTSFVLAQLSQSKDFAGAAALEALSVLDPMGAIERLADVRDAERNLSRNQWLPMLLHAHPEETRRRILEIAETDANGRVMIEILFGDRPDEMDGAILRFLLRALETDLRQRLDEALTGDPHWITRPLELIGRITHPKLLHVLQEEAGSELEQMVSAVASSHVRIDSRMRDHVRESARRALILIGGSGIARLIEAELSSEHYWVRHAGLNWAFLRAEGDIVERLVEIARRPVPRDASGKPESEPYLEFYQAITALAALGPDAVLVETLWQTGMAAVPVDLAALRSHRGPLPKDLTERARRVLENAETEEALLTALVIAWISRDTDLISSVRSVFDSADPESRAARHACIALQELGDQSDDFARLALRLVRSEANAAWGLNALLSLGDRGLELLGRWLEGRNAVSRTDHDDVAIRALYQSPRTRELSVAAAVDRCLRGRFLLDGPYEIAAEASDLAVREQILDKAFATRAFVTTLPLRAIEGLAKFDARRAVEAIEIGLHAHPKIENELCQLLVRIAPATAADILLEAACSCERESLRKSAGRALRRLDPAVVSRVLVDQLGRSPSQRRAAAELAGWLPMPEVAEALGHAADRDSAREVRHAALVALERHRREASVRALLAAFPSATSALRWSLLVAILDAADPQLLTDSRDPLWLGQFLSADVPYAFAHHAKSTLRHRKQREE